MLLQEVEGSVRSSEYLTHISQRSNLRGSRSIGFRVLIKALSITVTNEQHDAQELVVSILRHGRVSVIVSELKGQSGQATGKPEI